MTSSTTILDLPIEILHYIISLADISRNGPYYLDFRFPDRLSEGLDKSIQNTIPKTEYPLYQSVSQVCKLWRSVVTPLMFETVFLFSHNKSWWKLNQICQTPHLAQHVRTIKLYTIRHLPIFSSMTEWMENFENYIPEEAKYRISEWVAKPVDKTRPKLTGIYERYQWWRRGETKMDKHWEKGGTPVLHLKLLSKLQRVETIGHQCLSISDRIRVYAFKHAYNERTMWAGHFSERWRRECNVSRREVETLVPDNRRFEWKDGKPFSKVNPCHLETFIHALNDSGTSLDTLSLRSNREIIAASVPHNTFNACRMSMQSLRRLELNIGSEDHLCAYDIPAHYPVAPWMKTLSSLEDLIIVQSRHYEDQDIFLLIADVEFPVVSSVLFKNLQTTCNHLTSFINRHRKTIKSLSILKPRLTAGEWERLREKEICSAWASQGKRLIMTES